MNTEPRLPHKHVWPGFFVKKEKATWKILGSVNVACCGGDSAESLISLRREESFVRRIVDRRAILGKGETQDPLKKYLPA